MEVYKISIYIPIQQH